MRSISAFLKSLFNRKPIDISDATSFLYEGMSEAETIYQKYIDCLPKSELQPRVVISQVPLNGADVSFFGYKDLGKMPQARMVAFNAAIDLIDMGITKPLIDKLREANAKGNDALIKHIAQEIVYRYDNPPYIDAIVEVAKYLILIEGENPYIKDDAADAQKQILIDSNPAIKNFFLSLGSATLQSSHNLSPLVLAIFGAEETKRRRKDRIGF